MILHLRCFLLNKQTGVDIFPVQNHRGKNVFSQNRQIYPLTRIYSFHAKIARPSPPPTPLAFDQNQAPTSFKTSPSPHRSFELQDSLDKRYISLHSCQNLSPSETGFIVSAHRLTNITLLTLIATP